MVPPFVQYDDRYLRHLIYFVACAPVLGIHLYLFVTQGGSELRGVLASGIIVGFGVFNPEYPFDPVLAISKVVQFAGALSGVLVIVSPVSFGGFAFLWYIGMGVYFAGVHSIASKTTGLEIAIQ
jgi:hypothetical protein